MASQKKTKINVLLQPAVGDLISFKPRIKVPQRPRTAIKPKFNLNEKDISDINKLFLDKTERYISELQKQFDIPLTVNSISTEILNYTDILNEISIPLVQFKLMSQGTDEYVCLDMDLSASLISSSLGAGIEIVPIKGLTEIEETVLETAANIAAAKLALFSSESELKFLNFPKVYFEQSMMGASSFAYVEIEIGIGKDIMGKMVRITPTSALQTFLDSKNAQKQKIRIDRLPPVITNRISTEINAELGRSFISAKELYDLQPGDVLVLDNSLNNLLMISIGKHLQLFGQPGIKDNRLALQITNKPNRKIEKVKSGTSFTFDKYLEESPETAAVQEQVQEEGSEAPVEQAAESPAAEQQQEEPAEELQQETGGEQVSQADIDSYFTFGNDRQNP